MSTKQEYNRAVASALRAQGIEIGAVWEHVTQARKAGKTVEQTLALLGTAPARPPRRVCKGVTARMSACKRAPRKGSDYCSDAHAEHAEHQAWDRARHTAHMQAGGATLSCPCASCSFLAR